MNIEIANRLYELRKQSSLSQEELAEKIGVSRQAVSKWERAESSPDTDNLIGLARLYGISLDELLFTTEPAGGPKEEEEQKEEPKDSVSIGFDGIHVKDSDGSEVHVSLKGITVIDKGEPELDLNFSKACGGMKENWKSNFFYRLPAPLFVVAAYLVMGFFWDLWHPGWLVFFAIPIYYVTVSMCLAEGIRNKLNIFPLPLLCVPAYLAMGFFYGWWHPGWIIFLSIPFYYWAVNAMFAEG